MTDLLLDDTTWDLIIEDGDLVLIDKEEFEVKQAVCMTLKAYRGEWFRDITFGVPWIENENNNISILGKTPKDIFDSFVREAILSVDLVKSIISYKSSIDSSSGEIKIECDIDTPFGEINIIEEI